MITVNHKQVYGYPSVSVFCSSPNDSKTQPQMSRQYHHETAQLNNLNCNKLQRFVGLVARHLSVFRKGRLHHHEVAKLDGKQRFHWWRWLAFWNYNNKGPKLAISWWIAWTFFYGSALFTLGSAASLSHKVWPCSFQDALMHAAHSLLSCMACTLIHWSVYVTFSTVRHHPVEGHESHAMCSSLVPKPQQPVDVTAGDSRVFLLCM